MIVLTGAGGFVGSQLIQSFGQQVPLLLVSRDARPLKLRFPDVDVCDYEGLSSRDLAGAVFIHLAARNNDRSGTPAEFHAGNVEHLIRTLEIAKEGGAKQFINLCTTHALGPTDGDLYGMSKAEGARRIASLWPAGAVNLYVPAVHGSMFQGSLARLNAFPAFARPIMLGLLRQIKPVISVENLSSRLLGIAAAPVASHEDPWRTEQYWADPVPDVGVYPALKRSIDLLAVLAVLLLAGWAMVLIALYIRLDSKGPAVFAQQRVGKDGKVFTCYKFRTMAVGTAHAATHDTSESAVTRVGRFLRRTKLDELPQIANVLMNQMSLVGPRPCLPLQIELVERRRERGVLALKPGITGLSQIGAIDMSDPARLSAWDDRYRAFRTSVLDLVIILRTIIGGGSGDRVSRPAK